VLKYSHVLNLIEETGLSYEEISPILNISNMTLRRWAKKPKTTKVAAGYQSAIREGVYQLLLDGRVDSGSKVVLEILQSTPSKSFAAAIKSLGAANMRFDKDVKNQDQVVLILAEIGQNKKHIDDVESQQEEILKFKKFGQGWTKSISVLMKVIKSKDVFALDKLVAYGALFYLIFPFDLIPDSIPVVGYIDDFAFLSIAAAFYLRKFPNLMTVRS
jgi:uncharacterized membrane protein YkvA (DUF1232 family)